MQTKSFWIAVCGVMMAGLAVCAEFVTKANTLKHERCDFRRFQYAVPAVLVVVLIKRTHSVCRRSG